MYSQPWSPVPSTTAVRAGVAHAEALAGHAAEERLAVDRAVQHGVADDDVLVGAAAEVVGRPHDDAPARQSLADVVVGLADQIERDAARQERAEALPGGAGELHVDRVVGQALVAVAARDLARQHRADRAVDVADRQDERRPSRRARAPGARARSACCRAPCPGRGPAPRRGGAARRPAPPGSEDAREVEPLRLPVLDALSRVEQIGAADQLVEACGCRAAPSSRALPRRRRRRS